MQFNAVNENRMVCTITHPVNLPSVMCSLCGICYGQSGPWISFSFFTLVCRAIYAEYSFPDDQLLQYFRLCSQLGLCVRELEPEGSLVSVTKLTLLVLYMHFRYEICS